MTRRMNISQATFRMAGRAHVQIWCSVLHLELDLEMHVVVPKIA